MGNGKEKRRLGSEGQEIIYICAIFAACSSTHSFCDYVVAHFQATKYF